MGADTYAINHDTVVGDMRTQVGTVTTTDMAETVFVTGMNYIYGGSCSAVDPKAAASQGLSLNNTNDGSFAITTAVSGTVYQTIIYGR